MGKIIVGEATGKEVAGPIYTKVFGVTFEGRQEVAKNLSRNQVLLLKRDPGNQYDRNAVGVFTQELKQVGFLSKELAAELAPKMDSGSRYACIVKQVTGGEGNQSIGVNIVISSQEAL